MGLILNYMANYLFVCLGNYHRSPWAANWFRSYCEENNIKAEVKSAGLDTDVFSHEEGKGIQLTKSTVYWADRIVVMEPYMKDFILENYLNNHFDEDKITVLDVPDRFRDCLEKNSHKLDISHEKAYQLMISGTGLFGPRLFSKILESKLEQILLKEPIISSSIFQVHLALN